LTIESLTLFLLEEVESLFHLKVEDYFFWSGASDIAEDATEEKPLPLDIQT
jgi:hypothetical protein